MKIFTFSLFLFGCFNVLSAQSIFVPWEGQREVFKVEDFQREIDFIGGVQKQPCGKYFLYQEIRDQKILTFKMHTTEHDDKIAVAAFQSVGQKTTKVRIENKLKIPTVEYFSQFKNNSNKTPVFLIRIPAKEYRASKCLANFSLW